MIIGVTGFIGSGKDTVAKLFVGKGAKQDSFAAPLKDVCSSIFGWPRELMEGDTVESRDFRETPDMYWTRKLEIDNFTPRLALQLLGTDIMRNHFDESIWLHSLEYRLRKTQATNSFVIVSDARFRNELDLIKSLGGYIINVQRQELPEWYDLAVSANLGNIPAKHAMETKYKHIHASEWKWVGYKADFQIDNTGTLQDLQNAVDAVYNNIYETKFRVLK